MSDVTFAGLKARMGHEKKGDCNSACHELCEKCYADRLEKAFEELRDEAEAMKEITSSAPKSEYARHIEWRRGVKEILEGLGLVIFGLWVASVELRLKAAQILGEIVKDAFEGKK